MRTWNANDWASVEFRIPDRVLFADMNPATLRLLRRLVPTDVRYEYACGAFRWMAYIPELSAKKLGQTEGSCPTLCFLRTENLGKFKITLSVMGPGDVLLEEVDK